MNALPVQARIRLRQAKTSVYGVPVLVRPKVVHWRDRTRRASGPCCGAIMYPRIPAVHLADDPQEVTCKRCRRYLP